MKSEVSTFFRRVMLLCRKASVLCREQCFFTCWQLVLCQSTRLQISLHWPIHPGNECCALPILLPVSTFHIQYNTNAEPLHSHSHHISHHCVSQLPLDSRFFLFFLPPQHKMWPVARCNRTEKPESASYLSFLGTQTYCQCRKNWQQRETQQEREKGRELVGAEGLHKHDEQIRDLSINQAVTTRSRANWIVPGSPERAQTILSSALLNY